MSGRISKSIASGLFAVRPLILLAFIAATVLLGFQASKIQLNTDIRKMVPLDHPYIQNFLEHQNDLSLGNDVRVIVAETQGDDIFNEDYVNALKEITDEVFALEGVDPSKIRSLWTSNVRWNEVTEQGFQGGEVIPAGYDGSQDSLEQLRTNVLRSGQVGRLVADNFQSSVVHAYLLDALGDDGVDIPVLSARLEEIRGKYQDKYPNVRIHIVGLAKKAGDVMAAAEEVAMFFFFTLGLIALLLLIDTRCLRSALTVTACSFVAVIWQLGIVSSLGFTIDPYSMLVPFLVFAIAVSHGVQIVNTLANYAAEGRSSLDSARATFQALCVPGMVALVSDAIGFLTLYMIDVGVIRELAMAASIGVAVIIISNLVVVPLVLSYLGVSGASVRKIQAGEKKDHPLAGLFARFTRTPLAALSIAVAVAGYGAGIYLSQDLKIGDLDKGAPELWPDPCEDMDCPRGYEPKPRYRYNHDVNFLVSNYSVSADVLVVMGKTPVESCNTYAAMQIVDDLAWNLRNVEGVQDVTTIASATKLISTNMNEGSMKWATISRDQYALNNVMSFMPDSLYNLDCSLTPVYVFLDDHKAETLERVTGAVADFAEARNNKDVMELKLASGNAGVEAATNQTIAASQYPMLALVYAVVSVLILIAFRSFRAVICIIVPLGLTSILCQALMAHLGIGVKVATLPVIALGVGIGVDYGIYIYSKLSEYLKQGMELEDAYKQTLKTTGKAVAFTGITLAVGVVFWVFSSIKFQADMGILLTFMFLWNMIGALWLLPALARFLLKPDPARAKLRS
ncbi:RND transporter [Alcanivorax sp. HI0083]|uniref:efflux RND transporter permease subunit n=1 Tax=unclassified Alcanivorax TaxID=2638842 RepID=UPI0007BA8894|nr:MULTISPECIES: MMPL family transporter [unclassified Alcanivorax]KZY34326.1 RND transporter [Alcanivorax sp. HI0044]KZZ27297.1 RND transporter [Alcanivorax sp. HI0083]